MVNELSYPRQVILRKLFYVVVARHLYEVRIKSFVLNILPKAMAVTDMNYLIPLSMDYVDRTVEVLDSIYVWEVVEPKSPPQVWKNNSQG